MLYKYDSVAKIKESRQYKALQEKCRANPTAYTMFDLVGWYNDQLASCREFMEQYDECLSWLVDVKDIGLGDEIHGR
ncbi:MAG TPA: hypothetical protein DCW90_05325 [Lachnospiraceae bacterium]|nr:hypothetical protein [Lachnospiraceae bacterium]